MNSDKGSMEGEMNCLLAWQDVKVNLTDPTSKRLLASGMDDALYGIFKLGWVAGVNLLLEELRGENP